MPHTSKTKKASNSSEEDRISALPDDVLHHVLGFLQATEAVHTSVLAPRWRYFWKSMRCLRVNCIERLEEPNDAFLSNFMNCLLLLRDPGLTLDEVEIEYDNLEDENKWISIWIRHALSCQAQVLTVKPNPEMDLYLDGPPLVSRHLRRLEFSDVELKSNFLDFSSCTALEDLKIKRCVLDLSQSLKHMNINECAFRHDVRIRISVPNLISLQIISCSGRNPLLESMLSLETAVVRLYNRTGRISIVMVLLGSVVALVQIVVVMMTTMVLLGSVVALVQIVVVMMTTMVAAYLLGVCLVPQIWS